MIRATKHNHRQVGFVYLCNPNNPTGRIVTRDEVRALLDGIPEDVPVLIDEAYHHFVEDPAYETSMKYVAEGDR
jgi:histidinol-phosphate aminotransferase